MAFPGSKKLVGALPHCHHLMAVEALVSEKGLQCGAIFAFSLHTRPVTAICPDVKINVFKLWKFMQWGYQLFFLLSFPLDWRFILSSPSRKPQSSLDSQKLETSDISIYTLKFFHTNYFFFLPKHFILSLTSLLDWKVLFWDIQQDFKWKGGVEISRLFYVWPWRLKNNRNNTSL